MRVLDRYVLRNFLVSYLILGFVLIGLYVVADLALNSDEFTKNRDVPAGQVLASIGNYYGHQVFVYFRELSGIITLSSAIVTLLTMNRRNEMTALLASGVSLYRVIWPIVLLGLGFNMLTVIDQEWILPRMADDLVRKHDEQVSLKQFPIWCYKLSGASCDDDQAEVVAAEASAPTSATLRLAAVGGAADPTGDVRAIRQFRDGDVLAVYVGRSSQVRVFVKAVGVEAAMATGGVLDRVNVTAAGVAQTGHEGFGVADPVGLAAVQPGDRIAAVVPPVYYAYALKFFPDPAAYRMENVVIIKRHAAPMTDPLVRINCPRAVWVESEKAWQLQSPSIVSLVAGGDTSFRAPQPQRAESLRVRSELTPREIVLRNSSKRWMQFMSTADLREYSQSRDPSAINSARSLMHIRFTQPIINMILLLLGTPFALTRAPVNLLRGMVRCVLTSGLCFICAFVCQQISGDQPSWAVIAAWMPAILFGPVAVLMLDSVKT